MEAKEFIELDSVAFEDVTFRKGDTIKIHIEVLYKIMEQYHQSKVNDVVKCKCKNSPIYREFDTGKALCYDCEKEL